MTANFKGKILRSLSEMSADDWDRIANPSSAPFNPFISYAFLWALEKSGSATEKTGWAAHHIVVEQDSKIVGVAPCYLKSHSQGEYVFDHGWADAFARAGGKYYPKLQVSVPFSPVVATKISGQNAGARGAVSSIIETACDQNGYSSAHITFASEQDIELLSAKKKNWLERNDIQFHWHNAHCKTFDDFLAALSSSKRKNLRKERQSVRDSGIEMKALTGDEIEPAHWDAFWQFYIDTGNRKWGQPYLTRSFFKMMHDTMRQHILLVIAYHRGRPIAGALNFIGGDTLYGRNWGCVETVPFLHFETCYYQAIDFAIARGLKVIEAGAQGEHKLARGYIPVKTVSYHHFAHPGLARAVADYLEYERIAIARGQEELAAHAPFRHVESE